MDRSNSWVTIVIPTRDSAAWIGTLLDHYGSRGMKPKLLLDSRTRDTTAAIAQHRNVSIIDVAPFAFTEEIVSMTRDVVTTPWALFVNDDEIPSDDLFSLLRGPPPSDAIESVAISRRWAWYEPGEALRYGRSEHWQDRAGENGSDHHWRLFRPNKVTFVAKMHTDGFLVESWSRMPPHAYLVHFEWVLRTKEQRSQKIRRYDKYRYGFGSFFANFYLPEDQPPGAIEFMPFGTDAYDALAMAYYSARGRNVELSPPTIRESLAKLRHAIAHRLGFVRLDRDPKDRVGLKPRLDAEVIHPW